MPNLAIIVAVILYPVPASAYLGPGMGGGIVAVFFGFCAAFLLALWGILYFPIKRAIRKRRAKVEQNKKQDPPN